MASPSQLAPTFNGHINSTHDALILFEACLGGRLFHVARRLNNNEKANIKSGDVFIYEPHSSGIEEWTDDISWGPGQRQGDFLVYQLDNTGNNVNQSEQNSLSEGILGQPLESFVKKAISVNVRGTWHHLVSYYTQAHITRRKLTTPSEDLKLQEIIPRLELRKNFSSSQPL